jgi:ribosomal protein L7/L12
MENVLLKFPNGVEIKVAHAHDYEVQALVKLATEHKPAPEPVSNARRFASDVPSFVLFSERDVETFARAICNDGNRIMAIKFVRGVCDMSLLASKRWVDDHCPKVIGGHDPHR